MTNKIILITGVSSGFGRAFAEAALAEGYTVIGTVRNEDAQNGFEAIEPKRAKSVILDVTNFPAIDPSITKIEREIGPIDVLVNNAGYGHEGILEESPLQDMRHQFERQCVRRRCADESRSADDAQTAGLVTSSISRQWAGP